MTLYVINMKGPLLLSSPTDEKACCVDAKIVKYLTPYHVEGIRFLYQQCICEGANIVLNNDWGMNEERQICTFLSAVERTTSLIVCEPQHLGKWYYEFFQAGLKVKTANELVKDDSWEESDLPDAVLVLHEQLKHVKTLPINDWFLYVIQNLENVQKSRYINNISSKYRIAIINQNDLQFTSEFQWFVMKWTNSSSTKDKESFLKISISKKKNFVWPFPEYWRRVTWEYVKKFQPTQKEFEEYDNKIKIWCKENKPSLLYTDRLNITQLSSKKRNSTGKVNRHNKIPKRSRTITKQIKKLISDSSESEEEISKRPNKTNVPSDSDSQNTWEEMIKETPINNVETNISIKHNESMSDNSTDSNILNSTFDHSKPSTSKNLASIIKPEQENIQISLNNTENILNSLLESPDPSPKKIEKEFSISDNENDSCPILDLLFS